MDHFNTKARNKLVYKKVPSSFSVFHSNISLRIKSLCNGYRNVLDKHQYKHIINYLDRTDAARLYLMPKVHK